MSDRYNCFFVNNVEICSSRMSSSSLTFCPGLSVIVLASLFNLVATVRWDVLDFFNLSRFSVIVEDFFDALLFVCGFCD